MKITIEIQNIVYIILFFLYKLNFLIFYFLKENNHEFAIVRGYCSFGEIDSNAKTTLENAKAAGLQHDTYHFP
jgi:hypothetical protein